MISMSRLKIDHRNQPQDDRLSCFLDFTTVAFPPRDQFEVFRAAYQGVWDLSLAKSEDASFPARQMVWDLGKLAFTRTKLPGKGYAHHWRHIRKTRLDHLYFLMPFHSSKRGDTYAKRGALPDLHCLARPFEAEMEAEGVLTLFIPRDLFASSLVRDEKLNAKVDGRLGSLLGDYLFLLDRSLPDLRITELPYVVEATRCLIEMCLAPSRNRFAEAKGPINSILIERARRLIDLKLAQADLAPDMLCAELGVSRSRLYRLFEPFGGISAYIRRQRLLRTRDALSDSSDMRPVARIAEQWGFLDASAYSRAFRQEFGISPKEAREIGWDGRGYFIGRSRPQESDHVSSLEHLLLGLSA
ncbi:helix-turn-helix domain-containing protein [Rhizobium sp. BK418]|uniref:helix-turn-helix domain-containing protein n=1 Tax=Rhizobium sp. BK418 TaxID=2512120 RepID=UPI0010454F49|nr:helix-turn-helix domain-containing protein [Rhizobium sp. BK418]TCS00937.1 AraC-like DNA-binding protein [Rhizobium sp. BK418]